MKFSIGRPRIHRAFASSQRKHLDHAACRPLSRRARISFLPAEPPVLVLWLNQVTPMVLWRTAANPADSVQPPRQSHSWLGHHVVPAPCWFCGQTNKKSCSALWSNRGTRQFSSEPPKTPHASFGLTTPSIGPAKPFTSGSRTVYSVLPRSMTWPLPCTDSCPWLRLAFLATMRPAPDPVRPPGPSSRAYLSLHSSEAP
jgi:hypothetical protein